MATEIFATKFFKGEAYEWVVEHEGRRIGVLILDNQGTWYAQTNAADFARFESGTNVQREAAAIAWLVAL